MTAEFVYCDICHEDFCLLPNDERHQRMVTLSKAIDHDRMPDLHAREIAKTYKEEPIPEDQLVPYDDAYTESWCGCASSHYCASCDQTFDDKIMKQTEFGDAVCPNGHIDWIYPAMCEHVENY